VVARKGIELMRKTDEFMKLEYLGGGGIFVDCSYAYDDGILRNFRMAFDS